jgi:hypothetical protein
MLKIKAPIYVVSSRVDRVEDPGNFSIMAALDFIFTMKLFITKSGATIGGQAGRQTGNSWRLNILSVTCHLIRKTESTIGMPLARAISSFPVNCSSSNSIISETFLRNLTAWLSQQEMKANRVKIR